MKKLIFLLIIPFFALACEGPMGPPGYANLWVNYYTVESNRWILDGNPDAYGSYYYYRINIPQLTDYVYDDGSVVVYLDYSDDVQAILPSTVNHGKDVNGYDYLWEERFDCEISPGYIDVLVTRSDFRTKDNRPDTYRFKVVLSWR